MKCKINGSEKWKQQYSLHFFSRRRRIGEWEYDSELSGSRDGFAALLFFFFFKLLEVVKEAWD